MDLEQKRILNTNKNNNKAEKSYHHNLHMRGGAICQNASGKLELCAQS